ncbi:MAG: hypothetical protein NC087_07405 [Anaeroplasma bactoclasticum]|nr:hypothetical protein [Anaeroplasma bactoclasticum]MCM1557346.1 hypothetical protein [Anaeroplasma bactoclasticum]
MTLANINGWMKMFMVGMIDYIKENEERMKKMSKGKDVSSNSHTNKTSE